MPRLELSARKRVIVLQRAGYTLSEIHKRIVEEEGHYVSLRSIYRLWKKFCGHHTIADLPKNKRQRILNDKMLDMIDRLLMENDKVNARQLRDRLLDVHPELKVSLDTIKSYRKKKGWVCTRPHYCQLIRQVNKVKRLEWCLEQINNNERFENVIFSDECTVQLEQHSKLYFRKERQPRVLKQRPKHPPKVHIWGGISCRGATKIVIFTGTMNAIRYGNILSASLLPFITECYPEGHRFQKDNDPKHTSRYIQNYFSRNDVVWWKTPPESPDLNPIENVWGSLKQFLRNQYKPKNLDDLKEGIQQFWSSLTPSICQDYIRHLHKVMPKVVEVSGNPSGY